MVNMKPIASSIRIQPGKHPKIINVFNIFK